MESHKIIHSGQKIFKCTNCPSSFFRLDFQLIVKLNFVGPVACTVDISLKSQFRQTDLNKHEKIHQEREKTFFCQFCKAGFFKKSYLKIHEQRYGPRPTILETSYFEVHTQMLDIRRSCRCLISVRLWRSMQLTTPVF